jgi:hypothetical protein
MTLFAHAREGSAGALDVYVDSKRDTYKVRPLWLLKFDQPALLSC